MSHIRCVYASPWAPDNRGKVCGKPIPQGSKVPLCAEHSAKTCACGAAATRRYQGKDLCPKQACG